MIDNMDEKHNILIKALEGFSFTFLAQIAVLVLGIIKSIALPKIMLIEEFGYWQIYALYSTYVGVFMLGYNDGVYLNYGSYQYTDLPFKRLRAANKLFIIMLVIFALFAGLACVFLNNSSRLFALMCVCVDIILLGIYGLLIYILQITNQIKSYSFFSVLDKIIMLCFICIICFLSYENYINIILADVLSKFIVSLCLIVKCKELFFGISDNHSVGLIEFWHNIKTGFDLMFAQLMGQLLIGIGRFVIDIFGNIKEYAFYSLGVSITNLVLICITAVSLVLYPTLKRLPNENYGHYMTVLNNGLMLFNCLALLLYFPSFLLIKYFLPQYFAILSYLHILFCVVIVQAKIQLVVNTFYKVLREQKAMLKANIVCVLVFIFLVNLLYLQTKNTMMVAISTLIAMMYRCYSSELYLSKLVGIKLQKRVLFEILTIVVFVLIINLLPIQLAFVVYISLIFILMYLCKDIIIDNWLRLNGLRGKN